MFRIIVYLREDLSEVQTGAYSYVLIHYGRHHAK
jgi:hypothetical protein